jgi:hypothetical protein
MDYSRLFLNELLGSTVIETSRYMRNKTSLSSRSIWNKWSEVCSQNKAFLGLIINLSTIPLPDIKD